MKILEKAGAIHKKILDGDTDLANRIKSESLDAAQGGVGSDEWALYVRNFCSNADQLARLKGEDSLYTAPNGPTALAYFAADGQCGSATTTEVGRSLDTSMKELVEDVAYATEPEFDDDFHQELENYV